MTNTVTFTRMDQGTREDYELLAAIEREEQEGYVDRLFALLRDMDDPSGYQITRYAHSLQAATRAYRAGEDEEMVVCALLHDIGDVIAPLNHSQAAAALLRPYVSERNYWIVLHHGVFQAYYYDHHFGRDRNAREQFKDHPHYQATVAFCEEYDQVSFDPEYESEPLQFFEPMVRRIFGRQPGAMA